MAQRFEMTAVPLPLPATHCRAFRRGTCTREPCLELHLTCPDGRAYMHALMRLMGGVVSMY
jgi:hypothetical protein